ncbi:MAG: hypothetical protein ACK4RV_02195 [Caulobacter sp.]
MSREGTTNADIKRHVDWSIIGVIGTIVAILAQSAAIVWWAAGINTRVATIELQMREVRASAETLARLDERTAAIQSDTGRIYDRVEALERRR